MEVGTKTVSMKHYVESITPDNVSAIHSLTKMQIIILCRLFVYSGWFSLNRTLDTELLPRKTKSF